MTQDEDDIVPMWKDPKAMFFFFGSIMLLMFVLGIWLDDGRFAMTGVVAIFPTCAAAIAWASRDMV